MATSGRQHMHDRRIFAFIGFVLGLGAPIGLLLLRIMVGQPHWINNEFSQYGGFYAYLTIGCTAVLTAFGYFLGRYSDKMADQSNIIKETLQKVNHLAVTDALTNIHNARFLHEQLSIETESANRYNTPLSCLMLDIDDFKLINDKFGHQAGDLTLIALSKILRQCVRCVDIVGRLGGEEFLVVMPHTSLSPAFQIAERIRQAVQRQPFKIEERLIPVTISVGVACYPTKGITDKSSMLKAVDDAMYQAKRMGKNKTVVFNVTGPVTPEAALN